LPGKNPSYGTTIILKGGQGFALRLTSNQNETMSVNLTGEE